MKNKSISIALLLVAGLGMTACTVVPARGYYGPPHSPPPRVIVVPPAHHGYYREAPRHDRYDYRDGRRDGDRYQRR